VISCGEKRYTAQECRSLQLNLIERCYGGDLAKGKYVGEFKCWPFSKPQQMHGVWVFGLEASDFYPNVTKPTSQPSDTWLQAAPSALRDFIATSRREGWVAYAVDFTGRQSLCDANYGQGGAFEKEVIVDHFNSVKRLPS
jgi:hypothetical protein